jgi:molybdopterin adenylyltransferase
MCRGPGHAGVDIDVHQVGAGGGAATVIKSGYPCAPFSPPRSERMNKPARIGIVTVSDRASRGEYEDLGGPAILAWLQAALSSPWEAVSRLVPDEQDQVEALLRELCDEDGCSLVVTTGGTGPARRDITPEATAAVCDKILDGFGELMRSVSLRYVPTAILSRQIAGSRNASLIVNLPGKPSAIADCLQAVFPAIPYCIDLIGGPFLETHEGVVKSFRPGSKPVAPS